MKITIKPGLYRDEEAFTDAVIAIRTRNLEKPTYYDSYMIARAKRIALAEATAEAVELAREIWINWLERCEDRFECGLYDD
jgi:hypothetical protein